MDASAVNRELCEKTWRKLTGPNWLTRPTRLMLRLTRMQIELDHLFVCTSLGAPEAEDLVRFGLHEGPPNRHPGQGTANRRFAFANAMIELLWVSDAKEAQSERTERTLLFRRWSGRERDTCPFGVGLRPADPECITPPFPTWEYRPIYLPDPLVMHVAETGVEEPMWFFLSFMRRADREQQFIEHPVGIREITGLELISPVALRSAASQRAAESNVLSSRNGPEFLLQIEFDANRRNQIVDFRPKLPLIFRL